MRCGCSTVNQQVAGMTVSSYGILLAMQEGFEYGRDRIAMGKSW